MNNGPEMSLNESSDGPVMYEIKLLFMCELMIRSLVST